MQDAFSFVPAAIIYTKFYREIVQAKTFFYPSTKDRDECSFHVPRQLTLRNDTIKHFKHNRREGGLQSLKKDSIGKMSMLDVFPAGTHLMVLSISCRLKIHLSFTTILEINFTSAD